MEDTRMFRKPFSFNGRIRRLEYGLSMIIYVFLIYGSLFGSAVIFGNGGIFFAILVLLFVPAIWFMFAQGTKRCHDRGNSGFYLFIPFYGLWMLFAESDYGENDYGPNPKGLGNTDEFEDIGNQDIAN
jgi:uncharacterized membrane protein YhaH (DUF805 family)